MENTANTSSTNVPQLTEEVCFELLYFAKLN